jgi:hypothetical protein
MKTGDFAWHNRKTSPYLAPKELHSENNRKISAYFFTISGCLIKDKTSNLKIEIKFTEVLTTVLAYKLTA